MPRRSVGPLVAVAAVAALAAAMTVVSAPLPALAAGTLLLNETFTGSFVDNPRAIALNQACLTGAAPGSTPPPGASNLSNCDGRTTGSPPEGAVPGWLQLTDARTNATGGMVYNSALPSSAGLEVEFDQAQYGGGGADGIGFFLSDGSYDLTTTGGNGGSLGYAPGGGVDGVAGGYIGVGLDAYGNGVAGNPAGCPATGYSARVVNVVSLRGPGNGPTGYCLLAATATAPTGPSTLPASLRGTTPRNVRISVSPSQFPVVTVAIDFTGTRTSYQTVLTYTMTDPAPPSYKFGFSASTGSVTDVHLIRNATFRSINPLGELSLVKQIDRTTPQPASYGVGDTIPYQFVITNTGAEAITSVSLTDVLVATVSCPTDTLGPGGTATGSMTCTGSHVVTGAEAQSSSLTNTATVSGLDATGGTVSAVDDVTVPITIAQPALALTKNAQLADANGDGLADIGESIQYSFAIRNTGNTVLTGLAVSDPAAGSVTCPAAPLPVGAVATCTADATYTVTEADILAGGVSNSATATASPPAGVPVPSPAGDTIVTPTPAAAAGLSLTKSAVLADADADGLADAGETITYSFDLLNTGTVTLTGIAVTDPTAGGVTCPSTSLAPGAGMTCLADADYTVTQADILAGGVTNTATAAATAPPGVPALVPPSDTIVTPTPVAGAGLHLTKTAALDDANGNGLADPGETIDYGFDVQNTGNVTVDAIAIADPKAGPVTCAATTLAPGATMTCTADSPYTVTEADLLAGGVENTATATATPPVNVGLIPATDTIVTPTPAASTGLAIAKTATLTDTDGDGVADLGETIAFAFTITNRGTITVTDPSITDPTAGPVTCPTGPLAPDTSVICIADAPHIVTEADILAGAVTNTASADATVPSGAPAIVPPSDTIAVPTALPSASMTLTADGVLQDADGDGLADAGETVAFTFVVTNTGNVTLDGIVVDTNLVAVVCPTTTLPPGASVTCTASYVVTAQDQLNGDVALVAVASATPPAGVEAPLPAPAQVSIAAAAPPAPPAGGGGGGGAPGAPGAPGGPVPPPSAGGGTAVTADDLADTGSTGGGLPLLLTPLLLIAAGAAALRRRGHRAPSRR